MKLFKNIYNKYFNPPKNYYCYIIVRQDLSVAQQCIQTNHASIEMALLNCSVFEQTPRIVLLGVENKVELENLINELMANDIKFAAFYEPDNNIGLSAVATQPLLSYQKRAVFKSYSLWRPDGS